ncbi:lactococcin G-beta/enterocin 1071B family bacteriocin [Fructobacillus durionis]|uniref:COMC family protein n=1 Tax=Fructobacillus durionis TaxID=283737 RepID=A0A1I1GF80_9LACO|nr:lactococcin G-beta/enterocin 1071B family bacteriocin [Fructobacillus durionis]SFC10106.1 COMC family protein [Fructobacillus durionis]
MKNNELMNFQTLTDVELSGVQGGGLLDAARKWAEPAYEFGKGFAKGFSGK